MCSLTKGLSWEQSALLKCSLRGEPLIWKERRWWLKDSEQIGRKRQSVDDWKPGRRLRGSWRPIWSEQRTNGESTCSGGQIFIHVLRWKWTTALSFALHQGGNQGCVLGSRNATSDGRRGWGYERCKSQGDEKSWKCLTFKAKSAGDPQRGWEKGSESIDGSSLALGAEPGLPSSSIPPGWHLCWSQR